MVRDESVAEEKVWLTAEARELSFGRALPARGIAGVHGAFTPDGSVVALLRETGDAARPVLVFAAAG